MNNYMRKHPEWVFFILRAAKRITEQAKRSCVSEHVEKRI